MFNFYADGIHGFRNKPEMVWQSGGVCRLFPQFKLAQEGYKFARRALSQSALYVSDDLKKIVIKDRSLNSWAALSSIHEILHRGFLAPVHPLVEKELRAFDSGGAWKSYGEERGKFDGKVFGTVENYYAVKCWCSERPSYQAPIPIGVFEDQFPPVPGGESAEKLFWETVENRWPNLMPYLHPQVYLSELGLDPKDRRRADYVLCPPLLVKAPGQLGIVIEIHGKKKAPGAVAAVAKTQQAAKRADLIAAGWRVLEPSRLDIENQAGPWVAVLDQIHEELDLKINKVPAADRRVINEVAIHTRDVFDGAWISSQIELVLLHAIAHSYWNESAPRVDIEVPERFRPAAKVALKEFLKLVDSVETIWGVPEAETVISGKMNARIVESGRKDDSCDLSVEIDPSLPGYLHWQDSFPSQTRAISVRRICLPRDIGVTALPVKQSFAQEVLPDLIGLHPDVDKLSPDVLEGALDSLLHRMFAKVKFREGQVEGIQCCLSSQNRIVLLPAGHGKSLIFQLAAFLLPGTSIVIEPLKALLDDQIRGLQDNGITRCLAIHSGRPWDDSLGDLGDYNIIYIAPERTYVESFKKPFLKLLEDRGLDLLVVDEAHSVSEYGQSFRVAYLGFRKRILNLIDEIGDRQPPTTIGLTATAVQAVVNDVSHQMGVGRDPIALQGKFAKENLSVEVSFVSIDAGHDGMEEALEEVLAQTKEGEKTLIFCSSQGDWTRGGAGWAIWYGVEGTERKVKKILEGLGRPTDQVCFYHGGLTAEVKAEAADDFIRGDKTIMVATCAFGTGVDVDDIRNVIHLGAPSGLEAWYQESGRAGRDGKPAKAYVLIDLEEDIGEAIAQAGIRSSEDGLNVLREELSAITWRGSIMRQMNLLLGDVDPTPFAKEFDPLKSFPSRPPKGKPIRLGSFPGWRFENEVYSRWIVGELEGAKKGSKLVFFHRDHDALIWKAVHRLDMLGLIKGYERTYKMNGNNSFALRVNNLQTAARREALVEKVVAFSERALGGAFAEQLKDRLLVKSAEGQWYFSDDINSANSKERILAASKALAFTTYETVRRIRMNSFFSLMTFFNLTTDIERREYINGYISRDPADDEFRELVEKDSVEVSDYQAALTESKVWAKDRPQHLKGVLRGVLQGDMQGGSIANFLLLHAVLSHDGRTKYSEARVLASNLLRDTTLPSELICWALDELGLANGEIMPELLEEILREAESNESQPDNIRFARDWAMSRKEEFGQTSLAHYQMSYWLRGN